MMLKRIITAVVALAAFAPVCYYSDTVVFPIAIAFLSAVAVYEILRCIKVKKTGVQIVSMLIAVACPLLVRKANDTSLFISAFCAAMFFYLLYILTTALFSKMKFEAEDACMTYTMVFYIVSSFTGIVLLRDSKNGHLLYLLAFFGPWISDTFAYFCGRAFGRHKLIPEVSPKKTIEGSIGGVIFTGIAFAVYGFIITSYLDSSVSPSYAVLFITGALVSVISQIGDLIASLIKRKFQLKDYGSLFPGHGGVLDRFDSVLSTAPFLLLVAELSGSLNLF